MSILECGEHGVVGLKMILLSRAIDFPVQDHRLRQPGLDGRGGGRVGMANAEPENRRDERR